MSNFIDDIANLFGLGKKLSEGETTMQEVLENASNTPVETPEAQPASVRILHAVPASKDPPEVA